MDFFFWGSWNFSFWVLPPQGRTTLFRFMDLFVLIFIHVGFINTYSLFFFGVHESWVVGFWNFFCFFLMTIFFCFTHCWFWLVPFIIIISIAQEVCQKHVFFWPCKSLCLTPHLHWPLSSKLTHHHPDQPQHLHRLLTDAVAESPCCMLVDAFSTICFVKTKGRQREEESSCLPHIKYLDPAFLFFLI